MFRCDTNMTRKTLINDNCKSDRRSNDNNYLSSDENEHKKSNWKESTKKSNQVTSEDLTYSDDIEGIRHEGSVSDRSASPTTDKEMKVNILYRGMVYRIKGIKVICSIVAGIIILLTAMLLLGIWIIVGSKENGELIWPWSETPNLELFSNETIADGIATIPIVDMFEESSVTGNTQTEVEEISRLGKKVFLNTSEEVEEALGHFQAVQPRPHTQKPPVEKLSPPDDFYIEYEYYYPNDAAVEYSLLHETLANPPSDFLESDDKSQSAIQSKEDSIELMRSPESRNTEASYNGPNEHEIERESTFSERISSMGGDQKRMPVNNVETQEPVVSIESEYDEASFKPSEFIPSIEVDRLTLNEDEGGPDHRLVNKNKPFERFPSAHHTSLNNRDHHFSIEEVAPFNEGLVEFPETDVRPDYEYKMSQERSGHQVPLIPVQVRKFDHAQEPHDEVDPHREVFMRRYDASQIIFDDINGRDPGFKRFFDDGRHPSGVIPESFARRLNSEGPQDHLPRLPGLPHAPFIPRPIPGGRQLSVPGTVHQIPQIRRAHIAAGFRPRITEQNSGAFSVRRGPAPFLHSRESIMQSMPHSFPLLNPRFPPSHNIAPNQTEFLSLGMPIDVGRRSQSEPKKAEPEGFAGTLRRMYKAASSLVPFSHSSKTGDAHTTASGSRF